MIIHTIGQYVISLWCWFVVASATDPIQQSDNLRRNQCTDQTESTLLKNLNFYCQYSEVHTNQTGARLYVPLSLATRSGGTAGTASWTMTNVRSDL